ncbi:hydroxyethylthiazole kinase [Beggiatoa leptomitoformis]|uniref:Hydroxyethylthiazole kinase n=1 Tax=Beggiatoa leptomitoformis TaxID=288004 RepID=A0A2N9YEA9_9GAMM|nr:hydroxyethylthiazole kinase [Beggiatoa leptomitoformis]ALG68855.1 hydroxyethylthiazole kinase [Beggiatoa leptomitoformis]AUI68776.1 hydroxyethylthiazole kinase [Beggiatoa leptomitoformis]
MQVTPQSIWSDIVKIREQFPLIHNITNYVVMNNTANALLALGASPAMAHAEDEVAEMVNIANALVINIGTLSPHWISGMEKAILKARELYKPIVIDPVACGATALRSTTMQTLLQLANPSVIRGNASEIKALVSANIKTRGADSSECSDAAIEDALQLAQTYQCTVVVSGATDYIIDNKDVTKIYNGHPMMTKVTGLGCTATALIGAFVSVNSDIHQAASHAMAVMGIAGEIAVKKSVGPGTLQLHFLDTLYQLDAQQLMNYLKVEAV